MPPARRVGAWVLRVGEVVRGIGRGPFVPCGPRRETRARFAGAPTAPDARAGAVVVREVIATVCFRPACPTTGRAIPGRSCSVRVISRGRTRPRERSAAEDLELRRTCGGSEPDGGPVRGADRLRRPDGGHRPEPVHVRRQLRRGFLAPVPVTGPQHRRRFLHRVAVPQPVMDGVDQTRRVARGRTRARLPLSAASVGVSASATVAETPCTTAAEAAGADAVGRSEECAIANGETGVKRCRASSRAARAVGSIHANGLRVICPPPLGPCGTGLGASAERSAGCPSTSTVGSGRRVPFGNDHVSGLTA